MPELPYETEVRDYLADCARLPGLDPRHHPTEDGAVKLIWHRGSPDEADRIRATFRTMATRPKRVVPAIPPPGPQDQGALLRIA